MSTTDKATDLHTQIMSLPCDESRVRPSYESAYRLGHRDARHAAAELVLAASAQPATDRPALADALRPFADIGAWMFARPLPDDTPVVDIHHLNGIATRLTRGHFKAAHTALMALDGAPARELGELRQWAVERWCAEAMHRPLTNVHRRSLDDVWRQVIRYSGGDPDKLIGPAHDDLVNTDAGRAAFRELAKAEEPPATEITGPMVKRLRDALEGECDGLSIDSKHARAVLEYVFEAGSAREPSDDELIERATQHFLGMNNTIGVPVFEFSRPGLLAFARAVRAWPNGEK